MSDLSEKIRRAREFSRDVNGWKLRLIRPLVGELHSVFSAGKDGPLTELEVAVQFTIDWEDVKECDIVKSGSTDVVPFDRDAWREVLTDDPELWRAVCGVIWDEIERHKQKQAERTKN